MTRKKTASKEVKEAAEFIAEVVATVSEESAPIHTPTAAPEPVVAAKVEEQKPSRPKSVKPKVEPVAEEPSVVVASKSPVRNVRIKATATVRGTYGRMRYQIESGQVYTFPEGLANWLIENGRAI
jgi:hypothetical protein